ncbi:MAG: hypothetical protein F6K56_21935 [Moorea sp. SIO3G5]|nr:hypothetical protein [Moorena sp. SIO3G5]
MGEAQTTPTAISQRPRPLGHATGMATLLEVLFSFNLPYTGHQGRTTFKVTYSRRRIFDYGAGFLTSRLRVSA